MYAGVGPGELAHDPMDPPYLDDPGVYRSIDGGINWLSVPGPWSSLSASRHGRTEMALSPSSPDTLYVSVADGVTLHGLWRTDNAWDQEPTWTLIDRIAVDHARSRGYCGDRCAYENDLIVDPLDPDRLYAGGAGLFVLEGGSWIPINAPVEGDSFAFSGGRLVVGSNRGVYSTVNRGFTWTSHNTSLAITELHRAVTPPGETAGLSTRAHGGSLGRNSRQDAIAPRRTETP